MTACNDTADQLVALITGNGDRRAKWRECGLRGVLQHILRLQTVRCAGWMKSATLMFAAAFGISDKIPGEARSFKITGFILYPKPIGVKYYM